jgi:hypothetical protein
VHGSTVVGETRALSQSHLVDRHHDEGVPAAVLGIVRKLSKKLKGYLHPISFLTKYQCKHPHKLSDLIFKEQLHICCAREAYSTPQNLVVNNNFN